jgi:hypothetical protein
VKVGQDREHNNQQKYAVEDHNPIPAFAKIGRGGRSTVEAPLGSPLRSGQRRSLRRKHEAHGGRQYSGGKRTMISGGNLYISLAWVFSTRHSKVRWRHQKVTSCTNISADARA